MNLNPRISGFVDPKDNIFKRGGPPPFLPPRPQYFEPEDTLDDGMCPACRRGGVCMCVRPEREVTC